MADAQIQTMDRAQAEQARLKAVIDAAPAAYQDHYLTSEEAGVAAEAEPQVEEPGLRSWSLETRMGFGESNSTGFGRQRAAEFGVRAEYRRETLNYGEFVLQADQRHLSGDGDAGLYSIGSLGYARKNTSQRLTLRNLGLPITSRTFADTTLGDMYSEVTDGLSRNERLSLGTSTVRGLSTRIFNSDLDVRAGMGERGYLAGGPYPGFEKSQGSLGWVGATQRIAKDWYVAGQIDRAVNIPAYYYSLLTPEGYGAKSVTSWASAIGYGSRSPTDDRFKARATLVGSQTTSAMPGVTTGTARGIFVEASARLGRFRHVFGAYAADPNLSFGDYPLQTGTRGAFWRTDRSAGRMNWGAAVDHERAAPDNSFNLVGYRRTSVSGNFQYLLDRQSSVGGNLSFYQTRYQGGAGLKDYGTGGMRSVYGYAFWQTRLGDLPRSRFSMTVRRNQAIVLGGVNATGQEVQWEQDWIAGRYETMRPELTTTLGYARDESSGVTQRYPTAGLQFRWWIDNRFSVLGNLRYTSQSSNFYTSRGLSGTVSAEKDLGQGWRTGVSANLNQARSAALPMSLYLPQTFRSNDKTVYVYLRWDGSSGAPFQTAGMRGPGAGAGAGSVSGRVYLDANQDGEQQAGETGSANVEVLLDGRYRTTTDREGRFEFPLVTTGRHQLTLTPETVSLPWGAASEAGVSVDVPLRGQTTAGIAVIKVGQ